MGVHVKAKPTIGSSDNRAPPNLFIYAYLDLARKTIPYVYQGPTNTNEMATSASQYSDDDQVVIDVSSFILGFGFAGQQGTKDSLIRFRSQTFELQGTRSLLWTSWLEVETRLTQREVRNR